LALCGGIPYRNVVRETCIDGLKSKKRKGILIVNQKKRPVNRGSVKKERRVI
jgi:hypothetical protein